MGRPSLPERRGAGASPSHRSRALLTATMSGGPAKGFGNGTPVGTSFRGAHADLRVCRARGGRHRGVTAVSPADAWATGFTAGPAPLLQHWDGTHWTDFPPPVGDPCGDPGESWVADGIDASSASNAFAVVRDGSHQVGTLVWHWDGNHWDDLPTPDPPTQSFAFFASPSVKAFSATDAWLIGFASLPTGELTTAAVHWDGLRWTRFPTPDP